MSDVPGPLYHGTTAEAAGHIESEGFRPERGHTYLTPHLDLAHRYANSAVKRAGGEPAVLAVDGLHGVSGHAVGYLDPDLSRKAGAHYQDKGPEVLVLDHSAIVGTPRRVSR
jgi:hypothetical protein